jgi:hypothetical protein
VLLSAVLGISGLFGLCDGDNRVKRRAWRLAGRIREPLVRPSGHPTHHQPHRRPNSASRSAARSPALPWNSTRAGTTRRNDGLAPPTALAPTLPFVADDPLLLGHGQVHPVVPITLAVFVHARVEEALCNTGARCDYGRRRAWAPTAPVSAERRTSGGKREKTVRKLSRGQAKVRDPRSNITSPQ